MQFSPAAVLGGGHMTNLSPVLTDWVVSLWVLIGTLSVQEVSTGPYLGIRSRVPSQTTDNRPTTERVEVQDE